MSILQFIGCLVALAGGMWIGALYVGLDLRETAGEALTKSQLLEKVPEDWRPVQEVKEALPTSEELAAKAQQDLAAVEGEIAALQAGTETSAGPGLATADADALSQKKRQATLAYWAQLQSIVGNHAGLQLDAESAATDANATRLAAVKARIGRYAADAIRALSQSNVDRTAVEVGQELADWYEQGAMVLDQAVTVWESTSPGSNGSQLTKEWERTRTQHLNEGRLLQGRVSAARDALSRRIGEGFAPITGI